MRLNWDPGTKLSEQSDSLIIPRACGNLTDHDKTHSEIGLCPNVRRASSVWDRDVSGKVAWCSGRRIPQFSAPGLGTDSRAKTGAPKANGVLNFLFLRRDRV